MTGERSSQHRLILASRSVQRTSRRSSIQQQQFSLPCISRIPMWIEYTNLDSILLSHCLYTLLDDRVNDWRQVRSFLLVVFTLHPLLNVEVAWPVQWNRVAIEQVGHEDKVAALCQCCFVGASWYSPIRGELVGDELGIVEAMSDHISDAVEMSTY